MAYNKVDLANGQVLIDLTADTVTADKLQTGITAHDRSGAIITGTMPTPQSTAILRENYDENGAIVKDITTLGNVPLTIVDTLDEGGGTIKTITADHVLKFEAKTVTPIASQTTIVADTGYDGLSEVVVKIPTPNAYQDENGYVILGAN